MKLICCVKFHSHPIPAISASLINRHLNIQTFTFHIFPLINTPKLTFHCNQSVIITNTEKKLSSSYEGSHVTKIGDLYQII